MFKLLDKAEQKITAQVMSVKSYSLVFIGWLQGSMHFVGLYIVPGAIALTLIEKFEHTFLSRLYIDWLKIGYASGESFLIKFQFQFFHYDPFQPLEDVAGIGIKHIAQCCLF
jgi:hypothetical protein